MTRDERVRPDGFTPVTFEHSGERYMLNAKYDSIHYFHWLGHYVLKIFDDDAGIVFACLPDEQTAFAVQEATEIPIVPRDFMYQSEYERYLQSEAANLSDDLLDGFDEPEM